MSNMDINWSEIQKIAHKGLDTFYQRQLAALSKLRLQDILEEQNLYLLRAMDTQLAHKIVERGLEEHLSRFDDYFFAEAFFRPLASLFGSINDDHDISYYVYLQPAFWEEITGDPDFYVKLIELMHDYPREHRKQFQDEWSMAVNRFEQDFLNNFGNADGSINWEKLVRYNSGKEQVKWIGRK